jgi:hypothetical protein
MPKWLGPALFVALAVVGVVRRAAGLSFAAGDILSLGVILGSMGWALRSPQKVRSLSSLYLWLAFILLLDDPAHWLPAVAGWDRVLLYEIASGAHLLLTLLAASALGAWRKENPARPAAGLFIAGAVIFWSGARVWPGMGLVEIAEHGPEHLWTSSTFLLATLITLAAMALLRLALQEAGDRFWATLGLLAYLFGAVFFVMHLGFRLTVMPLAAEEFQRVGAAPIWYEPWRLWAGLGFGIYHVLAYLALVAYGIALLKTRVLPRAAAWSCICFALLTVPWFGPPLFIHMMPWVLGTLILTADPEVPNQSAANGWPEVSGAAFTKI